MDVPSVTPAAPRLPWTPPTITRVPIVSHTRGGVGFSNDGGPGFDDIGSSS